MNNNLNSIPSTKEKLYEGIGEEKPRINEKKFINITASQRNQILHLETDKIILIE